MSITTNDDDERDIATLGAQVLRDAFIKALQNETVLYVENDYLMRKTPSGNPVVVRKLTGRNSDLEKRVIGHRDHFKIKRQSCLGLE